MHSPGHDHTTCARAGDVIDAQPESREIIAEPEPYEGADVQAHYRPTDDPRPHHRVQSVADAYYPDDDTDHGQPDPDSHADADTDSHADADDLNTNA